MSPKSYMGTELLRRGVREQLLPVHPAITVEEVMAGAQSAIRPSMG